MKLYYAPGACSLAAHIALQEANLAFEAVRVDLKAKKTASGADFAAINPKGYVPALELDGGQVLTENVAVLSWINDQGSGGAIEAKAGPLAAYRRIEALAYISTEIHKAFKPFFSGGGEAEKAGARDTLAKRFAYLEDRLKTDFLFGADPGVADDYLFVMLIWARKLGLPVPARLSAFFDRMQTRPAVMRALAAEAEAVPA